MMITATEAATVLGITPRAVRARLARGELRGHLESGRWMEAPDGAIPPQHIPRSMAGAMGMLLG